MTHVKYCLVATFLLSLIWASASTAQQSGSAAATDEMQQARKSIEETLGHMPGFMEALPEASIPGAWEQVLTLELNPDTALPPKYKALISLAVSSQIPCSYCVYFDRKAAMMEGSTEREMEEAVALSAQTRQWSTVLNGMQIDRAAFDTEVGSMFEYVKHQSSMTAESSSEPTPIDTPEAAYQDIERTLGRVPSFLQAYPKVAIAGAWKAHKAIELNPNTAIPGRYKQLIGLAVASQVPCHYCTHFHTEAAMMNGATTEQVKEAVALAGLTRHWSTIVNGNALDEMAFRKEVDKIFKHVESTKDAAAR